MNKNQNAEADEYFIAERSDSNLIPLFDLLENDSFDENELDEIVETLSEADLDSAITALAVGAARKGHSALKRKRDQMRRKREEARKKRKRRTKKTTRKESFEENEFNSTEIEEITTMKNEHQKEDLSTLDEKKKDEEKLDEQKEVLDEKEMKKDDEKEVKEEEVKSESKIDLTSDIDALVEGQGDLSEDFKEKAQIIFEAAIEAKVKEIKASLVAEQEEKIKEITLEVTEKAEQEKQDSIDFVVEQVDNYMDYVVDEWLEENRLALETSLKSEITESFMNGIKKVFEEHYIDIPEDKADIVSEMAEKIDSMKTEFASLIESNQSMKKELNAFKRQQTIDECTKDLTELQKQKIVSLAEGFDSNISIDQLKKKLNVLKSSYFKQNDEDKLNESKENNELETLGENVDTSLDAPKTKPTKMDVYKAILEKGLNQSVSTLLQ
jgi:hypothetical protein